MRVKGYSAKRGNKTVAVAPHTKADKARGRNLPKSSCINRISEGEEGMVITIRGKEYPYPLLPDVKVSGLINAKSAGRFYNKNIRGKYF